MTFTQLTTRLKQFLMGWLLFLGLKEGLVNCATVCIKSDVYLVVTWIFILGQLWKYNENMDLVNKFIITSVNKDHFVQWIIPAEGNEITIESKIACRTFQPQVSNWTLQIHTFQPRTLQPWILQPWIL